MPHLIDTSTLQHFVHPQGKQRWPGLIAHVEAIVAEDQALYLSAMTVFEIRRGLRVLELQGQGRQKRLRAELVLRRAVVLGMSAGWQHATELFAAGALKKPAVKLSDGDLLIAASAFAHRHVLVTSDRKLAKNLNTLGYGAMVLPLELR